MRELTHHHYAAASILQENLSSGLFLFSTNSPYESHLPSNLRILLYRDMVSLSNRVVFLENVQYGGLISLYLCVTLFHYEDLLPVFFVAIR